MEFLVISESPGKSGNFLGNLNVELQTNVLLDQIFPREILPQKVDDFRVVVENLDAFTSTHCDWFDDPIVPGF